jgi:hypothetical protein
VWVGGVGGNEALSGGGEGGVFDGNIAGASPKSSLNDLRTELFGIKSLMAKYEPLELGSI